LKTDDGSRGGLTPAKKKFLAVSIFELGGWTMSSLSYSSLYSASKAPRSARVEQSQEAPSVSASFRAQDTRLATSLELASTFRDERTDEVSRSRMARSNVRLAIGVFIFLLLAAEIYSK
jgi:hypothetical protein